jgi:hypothetical protein
LCRTIDTLSLFPIWRGARAARATSSLVITVDNWSSERLDHRKVPNPIRSGPIAHLYMWRAALHVTACVTCHRSVTCHGALRLACTDERCTTCATMRKTGGGRPGQNISRLQAGRYEPYGEPCGAPVRRCATCTTPRKWVAALGLALSALASYHCLAPFSPLMPTSGRATKTLFNSEFFGFSPDFLFGSRQESGDFAKGAAPPDRIRHKEKVLPAPRAGRKHHRTPSLACRVLTPAVRFPVHN